MKLELRELKKGIALLTIATMVLTLFPVSSYAFQATDLSKHWAKDIIGPWMSQNLVKGYEDGTFRPDNNITRAEFMSLVNGAFGFTEIEEIQYTDVEEGGWYKKTIETAKAAAYISGYPDNTMRPNHPIGRAEAASIIMKLCSLETPPADVVKFTDASNFGWAKAAINAVATANIMNGYPDGSFQPQRFIKRAEAVAALDKALSYCKGNHTYQTAGTYGPSSGNEQIEGNVTVNEKDIILQNLVIQGNLTIGKNVGDGTVTLKNVTVKGKTMINGGGENSILVIDSSLGTVTVSREGGKIRIVVSGHTSVNLVQALSGVKLEEKDLSDGSPGFRELVLDASDDDSIVLIGSFDKVTVESEDLKLQLSKGSTVETFIVDKKISVTGTGTIGTALIHASGVTLETAPKTLKVDPGIAAPTIGEAASGSGGGGGGGGGVQPQPAISVEEVSISGNLFVGQALTAKLKPEAATASYHWMRSDAANGTYQDILNVTGKTYQLTDADYNQYIKVRIEGTGDYTGAKTSNPIAQPVDKEKTAAPMITPSKNTAVNRESGINFTIDTVEGVTYYYTLDGSRPTEESSRYEGSTALTAPNEDGVVTVTINVIGVKAGAFDSEMATAVVTYSAKETVARPTITPSKTTAVNRESGINFTIDTVKGVTYYYTLDGSRPTAESDRYQGSTTLTAPNEDGAVTVTINMIGVKSGAFDSEMATATVTYSAKETVARPTITPSKTTAVNRESGINFTIDTVEGVIYYYTLDGSRPTTESSRYQGDITLAAPDQDAEAVVAINVIGVKAGAFDSEVATATVTYSAKETVARPTITPSKTTAVNRESGINFTIDTIEGVIYYYTLDGSRPSAESDRYQGATTLTAPDQDAEAVVAINVIGVKAGSFDSEVATATVTYSAKETVARPTITPSKTTAVNRESGISFTIDTVEGVAYYYTLDGARPTTESSRYQGDITLTAPDQDAEAVVAINVIGVKAGSFDSEVATATVTYSAKETVARPIITPSKTTAVNREGGINFTIDTVEDVAYYYTLDGSRPTTESSRYQGDITLTAPDQDAEAVLAFIVIGVKAGSFDSEVATATVTYSAKETVARPTITPSKTTAVNREGGINFAIDTVEGVTYYYTLDGSRPSAESDRYQGPTTLTAPNEDGAVTVTINVIGVKAGAFDSEMATATVTYSAKETVARPTITPSKTTAVNRESGISFTIDTIEGVTYYYTLDGSRPTTESSRYQGDITLTAPDQDAEAVVAINVIGVKAGSFDSEVATATVTYSAKETVARPTITPSKTTAVNREGGINFTIDTVEGVAYYYTLDGSRPTAESDRYQGPTTLTAPNEDGAVTVTINMIGVKSGAFDSEMATATVTYSAKETVARPTITPSKTTAVNRESGISFTIDTVEGVAYYYTLDGSRPTAESNRYQGSTALTAPNEDGVVTVTINVIGVKAGAFDSEMATATVTYSAKETVARPTITPSKTTAVNRESGINFTIDTVEGVIYYYTLDGSRPTEESDRYQGATTLTAPDQDAEAVVAINVIGVKAGSFDSEVATATVTYSAKETVARPTITPSKTTAVNRETGINFTIDTVEGVIYYYTLDGSRPTTESSRYQGDITLAAPDQDAEAVVAINVIGVKAGSFDSEVATAAVTYSAKETVARPTITPSKTTAVNRESGINFTIDTVEGVAYYYTLDGSRPTEESSRYEGTTTLTAPNEDGAVTVTINVIGVKAGEFDSEMATAAVTYSARISQAVSVVFIPAEAAPGGTYFPSQGYSAETINRIEESLWGLAEPFTLSTAAGPLEIKKIFSTSNGGNTLTINADNVTQSFLDWLEHDLATSGRKALQVQLSAGSANFYQDSEDRNIINGSEGTPLFLLLSGYPDWEGTTIRINFHDLRQGENKGGLMLSDGTEAPFVVKTIGNLKPADSIQINGPTAITEDDGELQLSAEVFPQDAYNKTVKWSVVNGAGYARISNSGHGTTGRLYAGKNGIVEVYATSAQDGALVSAPFTITITGQLGPAAPTGIDVIGESIMGTGDGGLTGVAPGQEYQLVGTEVWTPITGSTVTGLAPGSYIVRVAETEMQPAGMPTGELVVEVGSDFEEPRSTVERDPEETGGSSVTFDPSTFTFNGTIAYYEQTALIGGDRPGNYIGVKITAPDSIDVDQAAATFTYTDTDGNEQTLVNGTTVWMSGADYMYYYPLVTSSDQTYTVMIDWDGSGTAYNPETIVIRVDNAILLPADPLPPESGGSDSGTEPGGEDDNTDAENDGEKEVDLLPEPIVPSKEEITNEPVNFEPVKQELNREVLIPDEKKLLMPAPNAETPAGLTGKVNYGRGTLIKPIGKK